jgi:hypothetical protein
MVESFDHRRQTAQIQQGGGTGTGRTQEDQQQARQIDIEDLAERVYKLMLADARLERARRG